MLPNDEDMGEEGREEVGGKVSMGSFDGEDRDGKGGAEDGRVLFSLTVKCVDSLPERRRGGSC